MRAALTVYRRRGGSVRRRGGRGCRPMPGMASDDRCRTAYRVVHGAPVRSLDVQPGLVVSKRRLVAQLLCLGTGAAGSPADMRLGEGEQGKAQRQGASRRFEVSCHCSKHLNRRHGRVTRPAMARAGASAVRPRGGGLAGSGASRGSLLAVRQETRRRSEKVGEGRGAKFLGSGHRELAAHERGHRTERRAQVALVLSTERLAVVTACRPMVMRRIVMTHALRGYLRHGRMSTQMVVKQTNFVLAVYPRRRTQHGGRHRAPDG